MSTEGNPGADNPEHAMSSGDELDQDPSEADAVEDAVEMVVADQNAEVKHSYR